MRQLFPVTRHSIARAWPFDFDRLFDETLGSQWSEKNSLSFRPNVDVKEDDKEYRLLFDLPGIDEKDISVELEDRQLIVAGKRQFEKSEEKDHYSYRERSFGEFRRAFNLPEIVEAEQILANYKNGVLEVTIPKSKKAEKKLISVQSIK